MSGDSRIAAPAEERKAEDRIQIFELIARTLTRIGGGKPLVLMLDNLHGAEASIEALQYIVRRLRSTPTLVVGSYRQTETDKRHPLIRMLESFADDPRFVSITLPPFSPSEHRSLVESLVGAPNVSDVLARRLREATEGNPFFTRELVRSLVESGGIERDDTGAWSFSAEAEISADTLPATIQQAVEKRIERLPQELRDVLSVASVFGKTFDSKDLETLAEESRDLDDDVDRLIREGMLEEERESRGDRLAFSSGIVRDVLYAALSRRKRRSLHRKFAELLEKRNAGRLERVYPELVHHFSQADDSDKTVEYGLKLARKSLDAFSPEDVVRVSKIALEYLADAEPGEGRRLEGEARLLLAQGHRMAGHIEGALREGEAAGRLFEAENQPIRAGAANLLLAETAWQGRHIEEARRWAERGLEVARGSGDAEHLPGLLSLAATLANLRGEYAKAAAYQSEIEQLTPKASGAGEEVPRGGTLVVAVANPISATEPGLYQTNEEQEALANVFEPLVSTDAQGNPAPALCEKWSVEEGGLAVRLHLRPGVVFSDGGAVNAPAVKNSLERSIRLSREQLPAAFAAIRGAAAFAEGAGESLEGIAAVSDTEIVIRLADPLPIFPSLLTDPRTAIVAESGTGEGPVGTGPFRVALQSPDRVVLERNPRWAREPARIERIEFRTSLAASAIAQGLRAGELDIVRDLSPKDLEAILREPRLRAGLAEIPKKNTYFAVFHSGSAAGSNPALRHALAHVLRIPDLVWGTLGSLALPATGLIPPGILGHDAGRRQTSIPRERAREMVHSSGLPMPVRLRAAVHPILLDQYAALTRALFGIWAEIGVEIEVATKTMPEFIDAWLAKEGIDLLLGRWIVDYSDPDNFTFTLFHSGNGAARAFFCSEESDRILEEARGEPRPAARESLYRKFEHALIDPAIVVPLFHDVDYRIAGPRVRNLQLQSAAPYVNYAELGKAEGVAERPALDRRGNGGTLQVPIVGVVRNLDPAFCETQEQSEVGAGIYETLTRAIDGTRIAPWLASEIVTENDGARYRFRLRPGVRFHDGRRVTTRDVRHSWERLLLTETVNRWLLAPIRGARRLIAGETSALEGFHIVSPLEFFVDLETPVAFFPSVVSYIPTAILPEGGGGGGAVAEGGTVGTGPYRIVSFDPGRSLELERNPTYWRDGYPRNDGVVFRFGVQPEEVRDEFLAGRFSLAMELLPADAEAFRHDSRFASGYRENPRLDTYFVVFNSRVGPLRDLELRRVLRRAVDVAACVRRTIGRLAIPAHGIIPPGLLGYTSSSPGSPSAASSDSSIEATVSRESTELSAAVHPIFLGEFSAFFRGICDAFQEVGFRIRPLNKTMAEYLQMQRTGEGDLNIGRWLADYPDADNFLHTLLHSDSGLLSRYLGSHAELDGLVERGRVETDPRVRQSIYRRAEELIAREALLLPLFNDQVYCFVRPEVEGLESVSQGNPIVNYENLSIRR